MTAEQTTSRIQIPPEIDAEMTPAVKAFVLEAFAAFDRRSAELETRIGKLEAKIHKLTPQNSSLPPSTQHPHARPKRPKPSGKKRKPGGQPGHPKNERVLIPSEQCDQVLPQFPDACRRCGKELSGIDADPIRHQVTELPVIKPIVTEYQLHRLHCRCCGITTSASLPEGVPRGQCGPRLAAFTGLLMGHFRQSKRRASTFLEDLLNVPCSPGWVVKIQNIVSDGLTAPYQELQEKLSEQPQLFVDESPTKQKNEKAWLWVAVAMDFAVFGIFDNRKRDSLRKLIGDYTGIILNCDRAKMYFDCRRLQWCWAHLKRDIQKLIDSSDNQVKRLGNDLMRSQKLLFQHWRHFRDEQISWAELQAEVAPIRMEFDGLLLRGVFSGNQQLVGMCDELYRHRDWLWTFTEVEGIEPTNNAAERALRPAVIYRKLSFGTQSAAGSRFLERMLTLSETCRLQKRSAFDYLVQVMEASYAKRPAPSLLPQAEAAVAA
jgi:transposase